MKRGLWLLGDFQSGFVGILAWLVLSIFACKAFAQSSPSNIVPDSTLGAESSQVIDNYEGLSAEAITGGATRGINLFHSFQEFNVSEGREAYFFSPNSSIQNILSRVTGSNKSEILGRLGTFGESEPNLFLINPNGIAFGSNATLDVKGSFVATTANAVQFGLQGFFSATNPQPPSQLLRVNPSAFLFNQINQNAAIENNSVAPAGEDSVGLDAFGLRVPDGKSLLLLGGNVLMDGGKLNAYGGRVELGGVTEPGNINLAVNGASLSLKFPDAVARADVFLANQAGVLVNGVDAGDIAVNARNLEISGESGLFAGIRFGLGTPNSKGGNIDINVTEAVDLTENSFIYNTLQRTATGKAGDININAGSVNLESGSVLSVSTYGKGDAGNIFMTASDGVSLKGRDTEIFNDVEPGAVGNGGETNIKASSLTLSERSQIEASVVSGNRNQPAGRGNAGNVNIDVRGTVSLIGVSDEPSDSNNTAIFNTLGNGSIGAGGNITIKANSVLLRDGGQLGVSTFGKGDAGNISIQALDGVFLDNAYISSLVGRGAVGNGGNIIINSGTLTLNNGALLQTSVRNAFNNQPAGRGNAGNIKVDVRDAVTISDAGSGIFSTVENRAIGNGGDINIKTGSLFVNNDGELSASSFGEGDAGNIFIEGRDRISFNNGFAISAIGTNALGRGGDINIKTGSLFVSNGAELTASSFGKGDAGSIIINANENVLFDDAAAYSSLESGAMGNGSNISIKAGTLTLNNGALLQTSVRNAFNNKPSGRGNAGNIKVDVRDAVTISDAGSGIFSTVENRAIGNGGDINIKTGSLFVNNDGELNVSSFGKGDAGNIFIEGGDRISFNNGFAISAIGTNALGRGGDINIKTGSLFVSNGAELNASSFGQGNAGNIFIEGRDRVSFNGGFANSTLSRNAQGKGGNINISTNTLDATNGGQMIASTSGQGNAGNIFIRASNSVSLKKASIQSTVEAGGVGKGGNIDINATSLSLTDGAQLITITRGASANQPAGRGDAGNVNLKITDAVDIIGDNSGIGSAVSEGTVGNGGNISIDSSSFSLRDDAQIVTSTYGQGDAGNVTVRAKDVVFLSGSRSNIFSTVQATGVGAGGNIDINAASVSLQDNASLLASTYGQGSAGNVTINTKDSILLDKANIYSTVEQGGVGNGGNISVRAREISINKGSLQTLVRGNYDNQPAGRGNAGQIDIDVLEAVNISDTDSGLFSVAQDGTIGNGGSINIKTGSLVASDGAEIIASIFGKGSAGNILIDVRENVRFDKSSAYSTVGFQGDGNGGDIKIKAGSLFVTNGAEIVTSTFGIGSAGNVIIDVSNNVLFDRANAFTSVDVNGRGKAGDIRISTDLLSVINGAILTSSTSGQGSAGNVLIDATENVLLDNKSAASAIVQRGAVGNGGDIRINTNSLSVTNGSELQTNTNGRGDAGNLIVNARERISFDTGGALSRVEKEGAGKGGDIRINTSLFSVTNGSQLTASTLGQGNAGNIQIQAAESVNIAGSSTIDGFSSGLFSTTFGSSTGKGGNITIDTNIFRVSNGAFLDARTRNDGRGGDITVNANLVEALNGGQLLTTTSGRGRAGKITVNASDRVFLNGSDATFNQRFTDFNDAVTNKDAGAASGFFVLSTSSAIAGDIEVNSPKISLDNGGRFIASSASGNGGNINLTVSDLLLMRRAAQISTNAGTAQKGGDGGNIDINSRFIVAIPKENSDITANAFTGAGGKVEITSLGVFGIEPRQRANDTTSDITASSEEGVQGVTAINAPDNSGIQNSLNQLSDNPIDANALIASSCISRRNNRDSGTFFITGKGGLPERPGDAAISEFFTGTMQAVPTKNESSTSRPRWKLGDPIIEPTGMYRLTNGKSILSRECD